MADLIVDTKPDLELTTKARHEINFRKGLPYDPDISLTEPSQDFLPLTSFSSLHNTTPSFYQSGSPFNVDTTNQTCSLSDSGLVLPIPWSPCQGCQSYGNIKPVLFRDTARISLSQQGCICNTSCVYTGEWHHKHLSSGHGYAKQITECQAAKVKPVFLCIPCTEFELPNHIYARKFERQACDKSFNIRHPQKVEVTTGYSYYDIHVLNLYSGCQPSIQYVRESSLENDKSLSCLTDGISRPVMGQPAYQSSCSQQGCILLNNHGKQLYLPEDQAGSIHYCFSPSYSPYLWLYHESSVQADLDAIAHFDPHLWEKFFSFSSETSESQEIESVERLNCSTMCKSNVVENKPVSTDTLHSDESSSSDIGWYTIEELLKPLPTNVDPPYYKFPTDTPICSWDQKTMKTPTALLDPAPKCYTTWDGKPTHYFRKPQRKSNAKDRRRRWPEEDITILLAMRSQGYKWHEIAAALYRSIRACQSQLLRLERH